jgi:hypothetical protein
MVTSTCAETDSLPEAEVCPVSRGQEVGKRERPPFSQGEAAAQDANELRGKWSFEFCRSGHSSLFRPRSADLSDHFFPPSSCSLEDGGPSQTLLPFLERCPWLYPLCLGGRGGILPSLYLPPLLLCRARTLHPLSGQERFLHRSRGRSPPQGGHRGSSTLSSASQFHQFHLNRPEKERWDAPHIEIEEGERGAPHHPFRMETVEDVRHTLRPGDWAASIDLQDSYFNVPLHHSTKKYMSFRWRGSLYCFCVLTFGLSPAPKVFTALTKFIKVHSRLGHWGGVACSHPPVFCLGASGKGDPYLFISHFSSPFWPVGRIRGESELLFPVVL